MSPARRSPLCAVLSQVCFDIRDDFDPAFPPDAPPLLHFGCADLGATWDDSLQSLQLSNGATLTFRAKPTLPAPPPAPPHAPLPPAPPPLSPPPPSPPPPPVGHVVDALNAAFLEGRPSNDLSEAGILIHQFDSLDDWNPGAKAAEICCFRVLCCGPEFPELDSSVPSGPRACPLLPRARVLSHRYDRFPLDTLNRLTVALVCPRWRAMASEPSENQRGAGQRPARQGTRPRQHTYLLLLARWARARAQIQQRALLLCVRYG